MSDPIDILIPTCDRPVALALTLAGLLTQTLPAARVIVADQGDAPRESATLRTLRRLLEGRGWEVAWHARPERRGVAEQRHFLLGQARARRLLFLDDDVYMEPWVAARLVEVLDAQRCGFVGAFPVGLSFLADERPGEQGIELWEGPVRPERVAPGSPPWERRLLHRAANLAHVARRLPGRHLYKVAWVGACVLYDREKLLSVGGFGFWDRLPRYHSGEEVLAQNLLLRRYGGCAILPSGTYHAEEPSTVLNAEGKVEGHALDLLPLWSALQGVEP